ncbi:unnamed protein product, partial [Ectocarpus sp. 4 AP-2014]
LSVQGEVLQPRLLVQASGMGAFAPSAPPAPETRLPPPAYNSLPRPPSKVASTETEELPPPSSYRKRIFLAPTES